MFLKLREQHSSDSYGLMQHVQQNTADIDSFNSADVEFNTDPASKPIWSCFAIFYAPKMSTAQVQRSVIMRASASVVLA